MLTQLKKLVNCGIFAIICLTIIFTGCSKIIIKEMREAKPETENWIMSGGNTQRTHYYRSSVDVPLELMYIKKAASAIDRTILVVDSVIYFGTQDKEVNAFHIGTGKKVGYKKFDHATTCAYSGHNLIIAARYGHKTLFKLDLNKSSFEWKADAGDIASEPLITDKSVIVTALYNHIDLYESKTGAKIWTFKTEDHILSSPALADHKVVFGSDDRYIYAVNESNGKLLWKYETGASVQSIPAIDIPTRTVYAGSSDMNFYALNLDDGQKKWVFKTNGQITNGAAVSNRKVIFGSTDGKIYCLDKKSGELLWQYQSNSVISTSPVIAKDLVFWGSLDHSYYCTDLHTGKSRWSYKTKGRIRTTPVVWGDYFVGASEDNFLYIFKSRDLLADND